MRLRQNNNYAQFFTLIYFIRSVSSSITHERDKKIIHADKSTRKSQQTPNVFDDTTRIKRGDNFNITRGSSSYFWSNYAPISPDVFPSKQRSAVYAANPRARLYRQIHHENDFSRPFSVPLYRVISLGLRYRTSEPHLIPRI